MSRKRIVLRPPAVVELSGELAEKLLQEVMYLRMLEKMSIVEGNGDLKMRIEHYEELSCLINQLSPIVKPIEVE